jgi:hypothetical protein
LAGLHEKSGAQSDVVAQLVRQSPLMQRNGVQSRVGSSFSSSTVVPSALHLPAAG